jgi:hypothetical protein
MHMGKRHNYLGMDMEFRDDGTLEVSMIGYLKDVIEQFLEEISTGKAATLAAKHLFAVRDEKETRALKEERALAFHHTVAQLHIMCTRAHQDIQTALAFLTMRVKNPDEDNWGMLKRVLRYLNGSKYLKLKLRVDNLGMLKWYVDGSHKVYEDCRGHGGALFSVEKGATASYSRKLRLNTRSLTESELIIVDMYMPEML